jgi:vacuole morphology and inheritance protein 14
VSQIIDQLLAMFVNPQNPFNCRTGGLIGLAGVAIGVEQHVGPYLDRIVLPVVECCKDPDGRIRYHGCESLYNMYVFHNAYS